MSGTAAIARSATLGYKSPNEKLNIAAIGAAGKGASDIAGCSSENIVAFADPDWKRAARSFDKYPKAGRYKDFRRMLDKEKGLDAVIVSTPDHIHAIAAISCMERGLSVYVQKPMAHTVAEARAMREAARKFEFEQAAQLRDRIKQLRVKDVAGIGLPG